MAGATATEITTTLPRESLVKREDGASARTRTRDARSKRRRIRRLIPLALAACVLLLDLLFGTVPPFAGWDQSFYLSQVSSVVEDGDLDLRNDLLHSQQPRARLLDLLTTTTEEGSLRNTFGVGVGVVWLPAYLAPRLVPWTSDLEDAPGPEQRWSAHQLAALHIQSALLTFLVAWFSFCWLQRAGAGPGLAFLTAIALVTATPLLIYGLRDITMSHLASAAACCGFVAAVHRLDRHRSLTSSILAGIALGLVAIVRWQDVVAGLALLVPLLSLLRQPIETRRILAVLAGLAAGFLSVASLQLHAWALEYGRWLLLPQGGDFFHWLEPALGYFLLSGLSGLLPWSPVFLLGVIGLLLPWRCRLSRSWAFVALAVILLQIYINASAEDWWAGVSYGPRRLTSTVPFLALGLANLTRYRSRRFLTTALMMLVGWGLVTANLYRHGIRDLSVAVLQRSSDAPGSERELIGPGEPERARAALFSSPFSRPDLYFLADVSSPARHLRQQLTKWGTALVLGLAALLVSLRWLRRRVLPGLLVAVVVTALCLNLSLAQGGEPDWQERALWKRLARALRDSRLDRASAVAARLDRRLSSLPSHLLARVEDPYRVLEASLRVEEGRFHAALSRLEQLDTDNHRLVAEWLNELTPAFSAEDRRVAAIPAEVLVVRRGRTARRFVVPEIDAARLVLEMNVTVGGLWDRHPLLSLRTQGEELVALLVDARGEAILRSADREHSRRFAVGNGDRFRTRVEWRVVNRGLVVSAELTKIERTTTPGQSAHLSMLLRRSPHHPLPARIVLGRVPRSRHPAPLGTRFTDLKIVALAGNLRDRTTLRITEPRPPDPTESAALRP